MSFSIASSRPKTFGASSVGRQQPEYGVPDRLGYGINAARSKIEPVHPLEAPEKNYASTRNKLHMTVLRNIQGLHAPLRLSAELKAVQSVGRLHFLPSSNISASTLTDEDETIDFGDFLNPMEFNERLVNPHILMERKAGLL